MLPRFYALRVDVKGAPNPNDGELIKREGKYAKARGKYSIFLRSKMQKLEFLCEIVSSLFSCVKSFLNKIDLWNAHAQNPSPHFNKNCHNDFLVILDKQS